MLHILTCRQDLYIIITDCDPLPLGGRNVTLALQSRTGHTQLRTVVGMLVFSQFWFWFPFTHFLSLAFTPTAIIGLNGQLKVTLYFYYLMSSLFLSLFFRCPRCNSSQMPVPLSMAMYLILKKRKRKREERYCYT